MKSSLPMLAALGAVLVACKSDPPPPPIPAPETDASTAASGAKSGPGEDFRFKGGKPDISDETAKNYNAELCYFGTVGLLYARDSYTASLGGAEPGANKIPSFGAYENPDKRRRKGGKKERPATARSRQMIPFYRFVNSCTTLTRAENPANAELDAAAKDYAPFIKALNKSIMDSSRYYNRKAYEKDDGARGKKLHAELTENVAQLDAKVAAMGAAVFAWHGALGPQPEELDDAGKLAATAVSDARALTMLLLTDPVDAAAVNTAIEKLEQSAKKLEDVQDKQSAHGKIVPRRLKPLIDAAKEVVGKIDGNKLAIEYSHKVALRYAHLLEANHRALGQYLRKQGKVKPHNKALTMPRPNLNLRPNSRAVRPRAIDLPEPE